MIHFEEDVSPVRREGRDDPLVPWTNEEVKQRRVEQKVGSAWGAATNSPDVLQLTARLERSDVLPSATPAFRQPTAGRKGDDDVFDDQLNRPTWTLKARGQVLRP